MIDVLTVVAMIAIALFALLLAILILPIRIVLHADGCTDDGFDVNGRIMPLAGLVGAGVRIHGHDNCFDAFFLKWRLLSLRIRPVAGRASQLMKKMAERKKAPKPKAEEAKKKTRDVKGIFRKISASRPVIFKVLFEAIHLVHFDRCTLDIHYGFSDPALTGMLTGLLYSLDGVLPSSCSITPECDFTRQVFGGSIDLDITIRNYRFWGALIRLAPDFIRIRRMNGSTIIAQEG